MTAPGTVPGTAPGLGLRLSQPLRLVIWDCDGVLIDSEGPANRVAAEEVTRLGWPMTVQDSMDAFVGLRLSDMPPLIEARTGRPVPPGWVEMLRTRIIDTLAAEVEAVPGAASAWQAAAAMGLAQRVASNSSHEEMRVKFARTGLDALVAGRVHSARDVARGKPAPDLFLAAAAAEGVPPGACVVVEDSVPGTRGAVAAGMACIGFDPHGSGEALLAAGAACVLQDLSELPPLLAAAREPVAGQERAA